MMSQLNASVSTQVSLVPTWPYVGLNRIDFNKGVPLGNLADTLFIALQKHMRITLKPHLDPQAFTAGALCA